MCCLFGLIDYAGRFSAYDKNRIIAVLSKECEIRGTDATGIAAIPAVPSTFRRASTAFTVPEQELAILAETNPSAWAMSWPASTRSPF